MCVFFFQAEDGIRDIGVTGVQTCAVPIWRDRLDGGHQRAMQLARGHHTAQGSSDTSPCCPEAGAGAATEIGRASCRERGEISVVAVSFKKKKSHNLTCHTAK